MFEKMINKYENKKYENDRIYQIIIIICTSYIIIVNIYIYILN